ncbi:zinc knuckle CX2CX4HX4C containing protein [Tanacetum coccineum]
MGRSSFARCLIEVNSDSELVDVITIGVPSLMSEDFTKETIRVEYEWKPPRCDTCKIFGHTIDHCPLNVGSATNVNTSNIVNPPMESVNDGFQKVTKKKKNRGKSKSAAGYKMVGPTMRYEPKAPKNDLKKIPPLSAASGSAHQNNTSNVDYVGKSSSDVQNMSQVNSPNSFSALAHEVDDEVVDNIYDESANILNPDDSS